MSFIELRPFGITHAGKVRQNNEDALLVGPQLRALQGIISVQPGKLDADIAGGHFSGDLTFTGSFEADAQIAHAGLTGEPTCWTSPLLSTAIRSPMVIASTWSCVT